MRSHASTTAMRRSSFPSYSVSCAIVPTRLTCSRTSSGKRGAAPPPTIRRAARRRPGSSRARGHAPSTACAPCVGVARRSWQPSTRPRSAPPPRPAATPRCARRSGSSSRALSRSSPRRSAERTRGAGRRAWLTWAAATAVVAAVAAGFTATWVAVRYEARLGQMARETAAVKERLTRNEAALQEQVALYRGAVELLRDPATRVVDLRGQGAAASASGRMIWNDAGGGHLFVAGLPPAPAGKTYALWTISGGTPRAAGLFGVDASGRSAHRIAPEVARGAVGVFAVTLEPEGGTPAPTGPIVLASK